MTGTPLRIWRPLGTVDWWWLMFATAMELWARLALHVPAWIPTVTGLWIFLQAAWLKRAEPGSKAIYLYLASTAANVLALVPVTGALPHHVQTGFSILFWVGWITGIFLFRDEMRKHFTTVDPRGLELNGVMTFFFSWLYFQYWFRQIYREQTDTTLSLNPSQG